MNFSEEVLMAYADGETDEATRKLIDEAAAEDPVLAARIERRRALRAKLTAAYAHVPKEPVPARLRAAVRDGAADVVDLAGIRASKVAAAKPRAARAAMAWPVWAPMAACLVLGLAIGSQWPGSGLIGDDLTARSVLDVALDQRLASDPANGRVVRVGISFKATGGEICRTFQTPRQGGLAGLACHEGEDWKVRMAMAQPVGEADFRTASALPPAVMTVVEGMIEGEPLDAEGERAAKARGWR